ncbi:bifunctional riboflavin kinase/FAD synthetase [Parvibaculum sp.]|jgi:riboflavin kinase/FMN adenylyltransferase|uniref:bifunctional riboflavin kinase/FAD synthetase n=1 Tax=Parvibaculum sp. TaxID=2024848 RepID=UPI001B0A4B20|nr:bifunctional riboflavin kinase/FAD synthetase [Parvibaculum sp.]MBO6678366.1 bifunctional riboflavin kinase/FAD synthetase [Parvibaculum sp.]MBO6684122.1 bifunctional riboflavin kinase/FAD synthetase [Parvibaculum sp.]MBO6903685.1 bifunctional riboflavin kinase/FAD synthetase [Parvibaculum sp.]
MQIIRHYEHIPPGLRGAVYALGNFDGVHLGHRQVIGRAADIAAEMGVPLGVLVFEPHPQQFFFPDRPFFRLTPFRAKARLLERIGVDVLAALPFDSHMSKKLAPEFVLDVLVNGLHAVHVVAGYDFRFGKGRGGDAAALSYMGEMEGFGVSVVEEVKEGGVTYSSTRIRELLANGDPRGAAKLLGHWWTVETHVQGGDRRGRTIGFPTANFSLEDHVEPALGVYAVKIEIEDGPHKGVYDGVANVGRRPTFDKEDVVLEVHIFDFEGDIYGAHAAVSFIEYLRPEQKFDGLDSLKAQIAKDGAKARDVLAALQDGS